MGADKMVSPGFFAVLSLLLSSVSGLVMPMKTPSGEPDMDSVINHVTLMEATITSLQAKVETSTNELTTVKGKLQTAEQTIASLQISASDFAKIKSELQTTEVELKASRNELKLAESDIAILKEDQRNRPDSVTLKQLKAEFEVLKASHYALVQQINFTVLDAVSTDVKINTREIQSLTFNLNKTETDVNKNSLKLLKTRAEVANLTSEIPLINAKLNQSIQDGVSSKTDIFSLKSELTDIKKSANTTSNKLTILEAQFTTAEANYRSLQSRQNITEHEVAEYKALAQSTAADLKTAKTQIQTVQSKVNTVSTAVNDIQDELTTIKKKTNRDVAFQVTMRRGGYTGWTTLKFDTVDYNNGNGYNRATGVFTAPASGTYFFWANVVFYNAGTHYIYIYKGSHKISTAVAQVDEGNKYYEATAMITTHLDERDQIHFTTEYTTSHIVGLSYSSYGGALLHAS